MYIQSQFTEKEINFIEEITQHSIVELTELFVDQPQGQYKLKFIDGSLYVIPFSQLILMR